MKLMLGRTAFRRQAGERADSDTTEAKSQPVQGAALTLMLIFLLLTGTLMVPPKGTR